MYAKSRCLRVQVEMRLIEEGDNLTGELKLVWVRALGGDALQQLLRDGQALVSKELGTNTSGPGEAVHVQKESNGSLQRFTMEGGCGDVGGFVQVDDSLPNRGVYHAAEGAQHVVAASHEQEALVYVV